MVSFDHDITGTGVHSCFASIRSIGNSRSAIHCNINGYTFHTVSYRSSPKKEKENAITMEF